MNRRRIHITQFDKARLEELMGVAEAFGAQPRPDLQDLKAELENATVVDPKKIPPDVVTMNSKVALRDLDTSKSVTYTLVFPKDADVDSGKISVLAPIGTAILGYRVGATVEWPVPSGMRRFEIEEILYQPEAAGDYHL